MAYPDICQHHCKNFEQNGCPASGLCMATTDKPYFKPIDRPHRSWLKKWLWKREKKKICKVNGYNCSECIYHDYHFEGVQFRGVSCRLEKR